MIDSLDSMVSPPVGACSRGIMVQIEVPLYGPAAVPRAMQLIAIA